MPIGIGLSIGPRIGIGIGTFGVNTPQTFSMATVARDATSNIYCPANAAQWTQTLGVAGITSGNPAGLWLCQEASGTLADSIGALPLTSSGAWTYQSAITGWTRLGLSCLDAGTATLLSTDASLPDISTTSQLIFAYISMPAAAPAVVRVVCASGTTMLAFRINTTPVALCVGTNTGTGAANPTGAVRPVVLKLDRSNNTGVLYTDQEKLTASNVTTMTGKRVGFGGLGANTPAMIVGYGAVFTSTAAQMTDAQVKTLLTTVGWSIPWS